MRELTIRDERHSCRIFLLDGPNGDGRHPDRVGPRLGRDGLALRELHVQTVLPEQLVEVRALQVEARHGADGSHGRTALGVVDERTFAKVIF